MTWRLIGWKISEVKCYYPGWSGRFDRLREGEIQAASLVLMPDEADEDPGGPGEGTAGEVPPRD